MLLYHSFPRAAAARRGEASAIQSGIDALTLMMRFGLLLTPETLHIPPDPAAPDLGEAPRTEFFQERACFTLAERHELRTPRRDARAVDGYSTHSKLFGNFAIGLDPVRARRMGLVPVMYFYRGDGFENISRELLFRLRELRTLAITVANIEARGNIPERDLRSVAELTAMGIVLEGEPRVAPRLAALDPELSRCAAELLDTNRVPAWNLVEWIDIALNFFQTADSQTTLGSLAYFQQREWRLVRLFGKHVACHSLAPTHDDQADDFSGVCAALRSALKGIDPDFFDNDRLDRCCLLSGVGSERFFDFVEEIVCPVPAVAAVADLLRQARIASRFSLFAQDREAVFKRGEAE